MVNRNIEVEALESPKWAIEPPPAGSGARPSQKADMKSNNQLSDELI